jgi:hypothetical protein
MFSMANERPWWMQGTGRGGRGKEEGHSRDNAGVSLDKSLWKKAAENGGFSFLKGVM